ncbi:MAG: NUDIX domain-containing protein [Gammaproteobacteria bacterium]|nr:NUDIX domain-containing protein [Gammaproteobacteria bacterium]
MEKKTLSAGVVVVRREGGHIWYLLLRAYNHWDFPKGMVEPGETPLQGAIREVEEETSLNGLTFTWGNGYQETPPYGRGKVARYYVAETRQIEVTLPVNPELGHPEHDEYRWVKLQEARTLLSPRVIPVLEWAHTLVSR